MATVLMVSEVILVSVLMALLELTVKNNVSISILTFSEESSFHKIILWAIWHYNSVIVTFIMFSGELQL